MLEVVEHEQRVLVAQVRADRSRQRFARMVLHTQGVGQGRRHQRRIVHRGQFDDMHAVLEIETKVRRRFECKAGLANPACASDRDHPDAFDSELAAQGVQILCTSDERRRRRWAVECRGGAPAQFVARAGANAFGQGLCRGFRGGGEL